MNRTERLEFLLAQIRDRPSLDSYAKAYLFARLSIQTRLERHEAAFVRLNGAFPSYNTLLGATPEGILAIIGTVDLGPSKARDIVAAMPLMPRFMSEAWPLSDKEARAWVALNVPGLSWAKASFFLMLLGRMDVACIDSHMATLLNVKVKSRLESRKGYESVERRLGAKAGLVQWLRWIDLKGIPGTGHAVYFTAQGV